MAWLLLSLGKDDGMVALKLPHRGRWACIEAVHESSSATDSSMVGGSVLEKDFGSSCPSPYSPTSHDLKDARPLC